MANINETKQEHLLYSTSKTIDNIDNEYTLSASYSKYISDFSATQWFYAYQRRRQTDHNFMAGQLKKQTCQLPVGKNRNLYIIDLNTWCGLVLSMQEKGFWLIQHNIFSKKNERSSKELAWKELTIPLSPPFLDYISYTTKGFGMRRFIVAAVDIKICNELNSITPGNPIVSIEELKAQYTKETEYKATTNLNERSNASSTIASLNKRESSWRKVILVWPITGNSPPNIIYIGRGERDGGSENNIFSDIYNEWVLLHTNYPQYPYQQFDLFDLDGNRWIEGLKLDNHNTAGCIQFASYDQCQFLTCIIIDDVKESGSASTAIAARDLQAANSNDQTLYIQWKLFDARKGQSQSNRILSNQIAIPYWPNGTIQAKTYTEIICLITVTESRIKLAYRNNRPINALLFLFVFGKNIANTLPQSLFDARDYGQRLPIDSSEQGHVLWRRPIIGSTIMSLYTFNVLDAQNGHLLRPIVSVDDAKLTHFLGSLCGLYIYIREVLRFIDMQTGRIYKPPTCLTREQTKDDTEDKFLGPIEVLQLPELSEEFTTDTIKYDVSNVVVGRINVNGLYSSYRL
ncbi:hypothetical protein BDF19DRAFT_447259 [Syncephalis fuscata]|nr:hypothetical protein BDF19DRAFT_447259 [Syncephalis fuscata]